MIKTLKIKFVSITMALVFLIIFSVFTIIYQSNAITMYDDSIENLKNISELSLKQIEELKTKESSNRGYLSPFCVVFVNNRCQIVSKIQSNIIMDDDSLKSSVRKAIVSENEVGTIKDLQLRYYIHKSMLYEKIIFVDISVENQILETLFFILMITGGTCLFLCFIIAIMASSWVIKPVEKSWNSQKQFIADASHELKTPLTVLLANMDILEDNKESTIQSQIKWIKSSKQEALQMKNLIEEMLFLAKSDSQKNKIQLEELNISDILISNILNLEAIAFEKNVEIDYENVQEDLYIKANEGQMNSLTSILLENACKYSYNDTTIKVGLLQEQDKIKMSVNNIADVIDKKDIKNIFGRFYRLEKSRNKEHGGYGLGLSIAQKIVQENNMKISVESNKENGTTFTVIMNKA